MKKYINKKITLNPHYQSDNNCLVQKVVECAKEMTVYQTNFIITQPIHSVSFE